MRFVDLERRGCEGSAAKRTLTTSGWGISPKRCQDFTRAWTRNSTNVSSKRKWLASDSLYLLQMLQKIITQQELDVPASVV
jgi:hypothetical protein